MPQPKCRTATDQILTDDQHVTIGKAKNIFVNKIISHADNKRPKTYGRSSQISLLTSEKLIEPGGTRVLSRLMY